MALSAVGGGAATAGVLATVLTSGISFIRSALSSQIDIMRLNEAIAAIGTAFCAFIRPRK